MKEVSDLHKGSQKGFTLLEGIIAMTVISVGLMAALTLAISNMQAAKVNERQIVASNLAREGIEVVRNIRDSNWLKIDLNRIKADGTPYAWDDFLDADGENVLVSSGSHLFSIDPGPDTETDQMPTYVLTTVDSNPTCPAGDHLCNCPGDACALRQDEANGNIYSSGGTTGAPFYRILYGQEICYDDANNNESMVTPCGSGLKKVGYLITAVVRYDQEKKLDVVMSERLYNWR